MKTWSIDNSQPCASVKVAVGDLIRIYLPENPTTGFRWELISRTGKLLQPVSDSYESPRADRLGAAATRVFVFRASDSGSERLEFAEMRAWETVPPIDTFCCHIDVTLG
jgi:inhibitor of cysteine peptidase